MTESYGYLDALASSCLFATALVGMEAIGRAYWTDDTTPRTDRPVRFFWGAIPLIHSRPVLWAYINAR